MAIGGFGGLTGPAPIGQTHSLDNKVMSSLRDRIDEGIRNGNTKTMKINGTTGEPKESNGLNTIGKSGSIDITV